MARINLDEAIRIAIGATDACESEHDLIIRANIAGELSDEETQQLCDAASDRKQAAYGEAVQLAPLDFLTSLLTQQRRWQ